MFIFFLGLIGFLIFILIFINKIIKKVGQKIYIIYNQIYRYLICLYYEGSSKNNLLAEELKSYYADVIYDNAIIVSNEKFSTYKEFISELLGEKVKEQITSLELLSENINSFRRLKWLIVFMIVLIILNLMLFTLIYKI